MYHKGYYYNTDEEIAEVIPHTTLSRVSGKDLCILYGGTICSTVCCSTSGVKVSSVLPPKFIELLPDTEFIVAFDGFSEDISEKDLEKLYNLVVSNVDRRIYILHGTDTLLSTANYLDLLLQRGSVTVIGSQKTIDRPTSEAYRAIAYAHANPPPHKVSVVVYNNENFFYEHPAFLNKVDTYSRNTFFARKTNEQPLVLTASDKLTEPKPVTVVYDLPYAYKITPTTDRVIIVGSGLGNVSKYLELSAKYVYVVSASLTGPVTTSVYAKTRNYKLTLTNNNIYRVYWYLRWKK